MDFQHYPATLLSPSYLRQQHVVERRLGGEALVGRSVHGTRHLLAGCRRRPAQAATAAAGLALEHRCHAEEVLGPAEK